MLLPTILPDHFPRGGASVRTTVKNRTSCCLRGQLALRHPNEVEHRRRGFRSFPPSEWVSHVVGNSHCPPRAPADTFCNARHMRVDGIRRAYETSIHQGNSGWGRPAIYRKGASTCHQKNIRYLIPQRSSRSRSRRHTLKPQAEARRAIHCMQWNSSCSKWGIEDQPMKHPIEIPGLELR
jgi:hypothetical protein